MYVASCFFRNVFPQEKARGNKNIELISLCKFNIISIKKTQISCPPWDEYKGWI